MTMKVKAIEKKLKFTKETAKIINGIIIEPDSQLHSSMATRLSL